MSNTVAVDIHSLVIGRELCFPIHDVNGALLLNAGLPFTRERKLRILERGVSQVILDESDVEGATLCAKQRGTEKEPAGDYNEKIAVKLESLIRSGVINVRNGGPAARNELVQHGQKKYDEQQHAQFGEQHSGSRKVVDEAIQQVAKGREVDGEHVSRLAETYINNLLADIGSMLSVSFVNGQEPSLAEHSLNVAILAMAIGIEMGFDRTNVALIGTAGMVQDIGMALVPKSIREAQRPLTEMEFLEIQKHPSRSVNALQKITELPDIVRLIVYQSHERPDGSGYPRGRDKKSIHAFARILLVADSYTAMTSRRPHRQPLMPYAAMETLIRQAQQWRVDPLVVRNLLHVLGLFPIGSYAALSDGSVARVIRSNGEDFTRPIVIRVQDARGAAVDSNDDSAVVDLRASELKVVQALPTPGRNEVGLPPQAATRPA